MSLIKSRQPKIYRWRTGDLLTAREACELLGYKSGSVLQIPDRRAALLREFETCRCQLTLDVWIGGGQRFLRSEIDDFISAKIDRARDAREKQLNNRRGLKIAA